MSKHTYSGHITFAPTMQAHHFQLDDDGQPIDPHLITWVNTVKEQLDLTDGELTFAVPPGTTATARRVAISSDRKDHDNARNRITKIIALTTQTTPLEIAALDLCVEYDDGETDTFTLNNGELVVTEGFANWYDD